MGRYTSRALINWAVTLLSSFFAIVSMITIIGPSILAYLLGMNKNRCRHYGLFNVHLLASIIIGELFLFIISFGVAVAIRDFCNFKILWLIMLGNFICNVIFSISFYFYGVYRAKKKINKVSII